MNSTPTNQQSSYNNQINGIEGKEEQEQEIEEEEDEQTKMAPPNLDNVPVEILNEVASQLTHPGDILCLAMSCKQIWGILGHDNNLLWYSMFSRHDSPSQVRRKYKLEAEKLRQRQLQAYTSMGLPIPQHLQVSNRTEDENAADKEADPFDKYDPTFQYYKHSMKTLVGNLDGDEERCQGCFMLTGQTSHSRGSTFNDLEFRAPLFCQYMDENGNPVNVYHGQMERRWYCDDCVPVFCRTNLEENKYFGYDISLVRHATSQISKKTRSLSFTQKYYLFSDIRRYLKNEYDVDARDLESVEVAAKDHRDKENDQAAAIIIDAMLHVIETDPRYSFYMGGLYNREAWKSYLLAEWKKVSPYCIWGLGEHEGKVVIQKYRSNRFARSRSNIFFHLDDDADHDELSNYHRSYYLDDSTVATANAEDLHKRTFADCMFFNIGRPPMDEEEDNEDAMKEWNRRIAPELNRLLATPNAERHDKTEKDFSRHFLDKTIWEYASQHKFTAEQAGKAGKCKYCNVKKHYTPYGYGIHIFRNHAGRFYDEKWAWKSRGKDAIKSVKELGENDVRRVAANKYDFGPICEWDEKKQAMSMKRFGYYIM